jgi:hypothetical protein
MYPRLPEAELHVVGERIFIFAMTSPRWEPELTPARSPSHLQQSKETTMLKYVLPVAILVGATAPAFAAEYFIVRGPNKKCQIVEKRPTDSKIVVMGNKAYVSRDEATKEMAVVCK